MVSIMANITVVIMVIARTIISIKKHRYCYFFIIFLVESCLIFLPHVYIMISEAHSEVRNGQRISEYFKHSLTNYAIFHTEI